MRPYNGDAGRVEMAVCVLR